MTASLLIVGCGDLGGRLARRLLAQHWTVYGLRRDIAALPLGVQGVPADLSQPLRPDGWPQRTPQYVVYCAAAEQREEGAYRRAYPQGLQHVLDWLAAAGQRPHRLLFVSSTSVYAQNAGEWIDEDSPALAGDFAGRILHQAESLALQAPFPATLVRLAGLYGPGRTRLIERVRQGLRPADVPAQYSNRIHAEDAAELLACLLHADRDGQPLADVYLGVDDQPAPLHELVSWLCQRLGVAGQPVIHRDLSGMGGKRCRNTRARTLGWQPRYPGYRQGYAELLAEISPAP